MEIHTYLKFGNYRQSNLVIWYSVIECNGISERRRFFSPQSLLLKSKSLGKFWCSAVILNQTTYTGISEKIVSLGISTLPFFSYKVLSLDRKLDVIEALSKACLYAYATIKTSWITALGYYDSIWSAPSVELSTSFGWIGTLYILAILWQ